jgi:hypothetical protein
MPTKRKVVQAISRKVFGHPLRVGLYARVSTQDQQTRPWQIHAMREYAAKRAGDNSYSQPRAAEKSMSCWCGVWIAGAGPWQT